MTLPIIGMILDTLIIRSHEYQNNGNFNHKLRMTPTQRRHSLCWGGKKVLYTYQWQLRVFHNSTTDLVLLISTPNISQEAAILAWCGIEI